MSPPFDESQQNSLVLFLRFRAIWARKKEEILTTIIKAFQEFGLWTFYPIRDEIDFINPIFYLIEQKR